MIYFNINKNIKGITKDKKFVLTDFDHTLTTPDSKTIWGIISHNKYVNPSYTKDTNELYNFFRKLELSDKLSLKQKQEFMNLWIEKHIELFKKYHVNLKIIDNSILLDDSIFLRKDASLFLKYLNDQNIPVVIISSGFKYLIQKYLEKNKCMYPNIKIIANEFLTDNNYIVDIKKPYINSANKDIIDLSCFNDYDGISFGDQIEDLNMGKGLNLCHVGFLNNHEQFLASFRNKFDILLTDDSSFLDVSNILFYENKNKGI